MGDRDVRGGSTSLDSQASRLADSNGSMADSAPNPRMVERSFVDAGASEPERRDRIAELIHDLRTPLTAIRGYTRIIAEERAGSVNDTQKEYLSIIAENANRMIRTLSDLVQLAKNQPLHLESFDARQFWPQGYCLAEGRISEKSIRIEEHFPQEPVPIVADREKLTEALAEIFSSCVRFATPHGQIVTELARCGNHGAIVSFNATSGDIPRELQEAFNQGTRQEISSPETRSELGLGLSLACDFIRLHGGRASVSSEPGAGFCFAISLPALSREEIL